MKKKCTLIFYLVLMGLFAAAQTTAPLSIDGKNCKRGHAFETKNLITDSLLTRYDMKFVHLDIHVENNTTYIEGNVLLTIEITEHALDTLALEFIDPMTVDSIWINETEHAFTHQNHLIYIPVEPQDLGNLVNIQVFYHGDPGSSGFFSGITSSYDGSWGKNATWTLSESFNAKQWWPTKQDLQDKIDSVWIDIRTNPQNLAGSNGLLTGTTLLDDGLLRFEWRSNYPIDYYLISVAVAEYQDYSFYAKPESMNGDSILVQNYIYDTPTCLAYYQEDIDRTADLLNLFSDLFTVYPFAAEKYGHCLTPLGGGMEHQTMTTIGTFNFGLVAHELGHSWFGDNVTCATWSDIWINEGFASYSEYLADQYLLSQNQADSWMFGAHNYIMSSPGGSVYIPPLEATNESRIFNGRLSYKKGAAIIHTIRYLVNDDDIFFETLQTFQTLYTDSVATGEDFKAVLETVSGDDYTAFFDEWYYGEGYPTYNVVWSYSNNQFHLSSTQIPSSTTPLFTQAVEYRLNYAGGGDTLIRLPHDQPVVSHHIPLSKTVTSVQVDPNNWLINKVGSITIGTSELEIQSGLSVFPNPIQDQLTIRTAHSIPAATLKIYNAQSALLIQQNYNSSSTNLDMSKYPAGIYYLVIESPQGNINKKLYKR